MIFKFKRRAPTLLLDCSARCGSLWKLTFCPRNVNAPHYRSVQTCVYDRDLGSTAESVKTKRGSSGITVAGLLFWWLTALPQLRESCCPTGGNAAASHINWYLTILFNGKFDCLIFLKSSLIFISLEEFVWFLKMMWNCLKSQHWG